MAFTCVVCCCHRSPVLAVAWILAFSVEKVGEFYGKLRTIQKWLNIIVGLLFIGVGAYYCAIMFF